MNNVFPEAMNPLPEDPKEAVKMMEKYIRYMTERIDFSFRRERGLTEVPEAEVVERLIRLEGEEAQTAQKANSAYQTANNAYNGLELKVDKETGKVLSSNDYTDSDKLKLSGLAEVEANPSETPTGMMTTVRIGDTVYNLPSGGTATPFSFVGMVVQSTTLATLSDVQAIYGSNTTWIQHTGYMLRGANSSVTANSASDDGGADSVTPSGTNTGGAVQGHTLTAAESGVPAHGHGLNGHTHGLNGHTHGAGTLSGTATSGGSWKIFFRGLIYRAGSTSFMDSSASSGVTLSGNSSYKISNNSYTTAVSSEANNIATHSGHTHPVTISGSTGGCSTSTAGCSTSTADNTAASATSSHDHGFTNPTFTGNSHTNLPKYKNVYIWERTA